MAIKGIYAASMSIFNKDLSLDIDSTIKHAERLVKEGCHGVAIFGSTGQAQLISSTEKKKLIDKIQDSKFKNHFMIGTGSFPTSLIRPEKIDIIVFEFLFILLIIFLTWFTVYTAVILSLRPL